MYVNMTGEADFNNNIDCCGEQFVSVVKCLQTLTTLLREIKIESIIYVKLYFEDGKIKLL